MKNNRPPRFRHRTVRAIHALIMLVVAPFCDLGAATIVADFRGGGSSAAPVTDQADAWSGMVGAGWKTAWTSPANAGITRSTTVVNTPSLLGQQSLSLTVTKGESAGSTASGGVSRQYDSLLVGAQQNISFRFRLDSDLTTVSRIRFFDGQIASTSDGSTGVNATWFIRANSTGNWLVYNGTDAVNTELALIKDHVYDFTIKIVGSKYIATINNLTNGEDYISDLLNFYTNQTDVGGYLNFSLMPQSNSTVIASLGSIQIIPEPGHTALMSMAGVMLTARIFRKIKPLTHRR